MSYSTYTKRAQRYLGDDNNRIVHDLERSKSACEIDDILDESRGVRFEPDSLEQAQQERYRPCHRCIEVG